MVGGGCESIFNSPSIPQKPNIKKAIRSTYRLILTQIKNRL